MTNAIGWGIPLNAGALLTNAIGWGIPLNAGALRGMVRRKRGEKREMGAGSTPALALSSRRPSPPVPSGEPHHSAANAVSKRNLLPIPAGPTIPRNFARKILRNLQPSPQAKFCGTPNHPLSSALHKKNGPRRFPGTVGGLRCTTCDLRLTMYDARLHKS